MANPHDDPDAEAVFNEGAKRLWVPREQLLEATDKFQHHAASRRVRERDHFLTQRDVKLAEVPATPFRPVNEHDRGDGTRWSMSSPMDAIDTMFSLIVRANPHLRPRVGNPDEMRSNRLLRTLDLLKFRVTAPEPGVPEAINGTVVTVLNEEAVAGAALANKGGINLVCTYEAFGMKMHGIIRQEIIFTNHCNEAGRQQRWLSIPVVLTSHTWENGKNEQSHQDSSLCEALLGELSHVSRVVFVADFNTAAAVMERIYQTQGQIWTIVAPKVSAVPDLFTSDEARRLMADGALVLDWAGHDHSRAGIILIAVGAYQLIEVLKASKRLAQHEIAHRVVYVLEPGRYRDPRSDDERAHQVDGSLRDQLFPPEMTARLFVTHTRPEVMLGVMKPLHTGVTTRALGYISRGGTLNTPGLLFVNHSSWAHCVLEAAQLLSLPAERVLNEAELQAVRRQRSPHGIIIPEINA
jgi:phosphoketolase